MHEILFSPLPAWESFYVIVGSSAAALTGLMFVVIALVAESRARSSNRESVAAFGTPNIVHFCAVLFVSALLSAPWHGLSGAALTLGLTGVAGVAYVAVVIRRARRQTQYQPVAEDWWWHAVLPFVAYLTILVAALVLRRRPVPALFSVGAASLLLLFVGIHNAWDTVTYLAFQREGEGKSGS